MNFDLKPGLSAVSSDASNELINIWTQLEKEMLEQQKTQIQAGAKGVEGSALNAYSGMMQMAKATDDEANGMITNGSLTGGSQFAGAARGFQLDNQLSGQQKGLTNVNGAIEHLEKTKLADPVLERKAGTLTESDFNQKYVKQQGFKYGESIEGLKKVEEIPTQGAKEGALKVAEKAKTDTEKQIKKLEGAKSSYQSWYQGLGQSIGTAAQGAWTTAKSKEQEEQAKYDAAKNGTDFLRDSAAANANQFISSFENAKSHISSMLQTMDDALAQVDGMRA